MDDDSLTTRTAALMRDRAKDAEHAPVARFARSVENRDMESMGVNAVREMPKPEAGPVKSGKPEIKAVKDPEQTPDKADPPVRAATQHQFRPPGFNMGLGPNVKADLAGSISPEEARLKKFAMLNPEIAQRAHDGRARPEPVIQREPRAEQITKLRESDMRPIGRMFSREDEGRGER